MIVDSHAHLVPPDLLAAISKAKDRFPSLRLIEDGGSLAFAFAGGKPTRPVSKPLSDLAARLAWMDSQSIDRQVVGGWVDMSATSFPPPKAKPGAGSSTTRCSPRPKPSHVSFRSPPCRCRTARAPPPC